MGGLTFTYVTATNPHVGDADDYIVRIFDLWHRPVFKAGISRAI
jgi:hypothetical protein